MCGDKSCPEGGFSAWCNPLPPMPQAQSQGQLPAPLQPWPLIHPFPMLHPHSTPLSPLLSNTACGIMGTWCGDSRCASLLTKWTTGVAGSFLCSVPLHHPLLALGLRHRASHHYGKATCIGLGGRGGAIQCGGAVC